eukprot:667353-Pleurochrysis_carterae.AAC.1
MRAKEWKERRELADRTALAASKVAHAQRMERTEQTERMDRTDRTRVNGHAEWTPRPTKGTERTEQQETRPAQRGGAERTAPAAPTEMALSIASGEQTERTEECRRPRRERARGGGPPQCARFAWGRRWWCSRATREHPPRYQGNCGDAERRWLPWTWPSAAPTTT